MPSPIALAFINAGISKLFGGKKEEQPGFAPPEFRGSDALADLIRTSPLPTTTLRGVPQGPLDVSYVLGANVPVGTADGSPTKEEEEKKKQSIGGRITDAFLQSLVTGLTNKLLGGEQPVQTFAPPTFR